MTTKTANVVSGFSRTRSTRRSFIAIAGAALSAPVAAAAAVSPSWFPPSGGRDRLAELEDLNEIRALNQAYLRHAAAGAREEMAALFADPRNATVHGDIAGIAPADFGEHDAIEVAEDRLTATARLHVIVHTETEIGPECTLVEMAKAQGEGVVRSSEPAVLEHTYVRRTGAWKILHSVRRTAGATRA